MTARDSPGTESAQVLDCICCRLGAACAVALQGAAVSWEQVLRARAAAAGLRPGRDLAEVVLGALRVPAGRAWVRESSRRWPAAK